ncbi:MAG: S41 family peptidase [Bacteroidota bacterium]
MRHILLFSLFLSLCLYGKAQDPTFSPAQLKEDLSILKRNLEGAHPALYAYHPKERLDSAFTVIESNLNSPLTEVEFFRRISPLLKLIANGHTHFFNSDAYREKRRTKDLIFPMAVYWQDDQLLVIRNASLNEELEVGSIIQKINGKSSGEIFKYLVDQETRDGYNETLPRLSVQRAFGSKYALHFGNPDNYELDIRLPNGDEKVFNIEALPLDTIQKIVRNRYGERRKAWYENGIDAYTLEIEGNTAVMTLRTFSKSWIRKNGPSCKKFFNDAFKKIDEANIEHLIIDLRDNGGGDPKPTIKLFAHLYDKPFTFYRQLSMVTKGLPDKKYYKEKLGLLSIALPFITKKEGDLYVMKGIAGLKESKPAKLYYSGKAYFLTNPNSFSATGEMSAILKEHDRGLFIGEEAGGNPNQNTSGIMLPLELPNSKISVLMPMILFEMNVDFENTGHGVIPDHIIRPSLQDVIEGNDPVMDFTKELIKKGK